MGLSLGAGATMSPRNRRQVSKMQANGGELNSVARGLHSKQYESQRIQNTMASSGDPVCRSCTIVAEVGDIDYRFNGHTGATLWRN